MQKPELPKVTISDIFRAYWVGMREWRVYFICALLGLTVANVITVIVPLYYAEFFDVLASNGTAESAQAIILTILVVHLVQWLSRRVSSHLLNIGEAATMARIKQNAMDHILHHSQNFFTSTFVGTITARINRFGGTFEQAADTLAYNLIPLVVSAVGTTVVVYAIEPVLAAVLAAWIAVFIGANYVYARWQFKNNVLLAELNSKTAGTLTDIMANHSTIGSFFTFNAETARYREVSNAEAGQQRRVWNTNNVFDAGLLLVLILVDFVVMYTAVGYWAGGVITVGTVVLLQTYVIQIANKQFDFGRVVRALFSIQAQGTETLQMIKMPYEIADSPHAQPLRVTAATITFEHVRFGYDEKRTILDDVTLTISAGQRVALVGSSGAGKSTLVRLVMRLFDPIAGSVKIDDQDIAHTTLKSLRESVAFVPQEPLLFHRSLMDNIRYGRPGATDEEVIAVAKLAHCHEFIDQLPEKYESLVGERGIKLSGGERQRVAIARAMLKNAPILILDEATSSLDSQSELLIQDAFETLMKGKTVLVIAHRLSTIRKMDRILVIDGGQITEDGSHDELLKNPESLYKRLWDLQAGGFIVEEKDEL